MFRQGCTTSCFLASVKKPGRPACGTGCKSRYWTFRTVDRSIASPMVMGSPPRTTHAFASASPNSTSFSGSYASAPSGL
eukprot:15284382-Alexandrium_andersonii.AAC.1